MKSLSYALIALNICLIFPVISQAQTSGTLVSVDAMSTGVVKKIDVQQGKVTINHGPLLNLDMPAMTMVFRVVDPKLLDNLKADDKIRFIANKKDGALTIVRLEQVNSSAVNIQLAVPPPPSNPVVTSVPINNGSVQTPVIQAITSTKTSTMNPADSTANVANPVYKSVFENYQSWQEITDTPGQNWRAANDEMGRLGGHAGQLRDAPSSQITPSAQPAEPTMLMEKDVKIKKPAPKHDMNNMNQGK